MREDDDLPPEAHNWLIVSDAARSNSEVTVPFPRVWSPSRVKQVRTIQRFLDAISCSWESLAEAVRSSTNYGAPCRLDLSLERLTSKDCERLDSLLSGKWRKEESRAQVRERVVEEQARETLEKIKAEKVDAVEDHRAMLARVREGLE